MARPTTLTYDRCPTCDRQLNRSKRMDYPRHRLVEGDAASPWCPADYRRGYVGPRFKTALEALSRGTTRRFAWMDEFGVDTREVFRLVGLGVIDADDTTHPNGSRPRLLSLTKTGASVLSADSPYFLFDVPRPQ